MDRFSRRTVGGLLGVCLAVVAPVSLAAQTTTSVGVAVGTVVKTSGLVDTRNRCDPPSPPAPNVQAWWNALPPANRRYPFVGFRTWRNTTDGCTESRVDVYRALVTFNLTSVAALRGLVTKAELVVNTRALPAGVGTSPVCPVKTGGAGSLIRFGPAAAASLPPVSGIGVITQLQPITPFPVGNVVYVFPKPWVAGTVPGAVNPTTTMANGTGGASFVTDVTNQAMAALNGKFAGISWMLSSAFEGPLTGPVTAAVDCVTSYDIQLVLTHY